MNKELILTKQQSTPQLLEHLLFFTLKTGKKNQQLPPLPHNNVVYLEINNAFRCRLFCKTGFGGRGFSISENSKRNVMLQLLKRVSQGIMARIESLKGLTSQTVLSKKNGQILQACSFSLLTLLFNFKNIITSLVFL